MAVDDLYQLARGCAEKIKAEKPVFVSEKDPMLCLVRSREGEVFSGISSICYNDEKICSAPAEYPAIMGMLAAGQTVADQIMTVFLTDCCVTKPDEAALDILQRINPQNLACEVFLSAERSVTLEALRNRGLPEEQNEPARENAEEQEPLRAQGPENENPEAPASESAQAEATEAEGFDFFSGFGDETSEGAAAAFDSGFDESYFAPQHAVKPEGDAPETAQKPEEDAASFAVGVTVDESNPFNDASGDTAAPIAREATLAGTDSPERAPQEHSREEISPAELLKKAKKRKKIAKSNFNITKNKP